MGADDPMIDVRLGRIVLRDGADTQYIYLEEREAKDDKKRGFPIVIGTAEASEIARVVHGDETTRPLTHQLAYSTIQALGASIRSVDIVELKRNTFYAHLVLESEEGEKVAVVDARPSDAIALGLRARCRFRVALSVLESASTPEDGEA